MSTSETTADSGARAYLVLDFAALHRQRKRTVIVGALLIVLVFGYMTWLLSAVRHITKPQNLADAMAGFVEVSLPDWKRSAKSLIETESPRIARFMGDTVVRELPPVLRLAIENMVLEYTKDISDTAAKQLEAAFMELVVGARDELAQAAASGNEQDQAMLMARALDHQFDRALRQKDSATNPMEESMLVKLEKSQKALASLNDRLEKLLDPKSEPTTKRSKMERRFIMTFWKFMQQENSDLRIGPDGKASDGGGAKANQVSPPTK
ncbi:MAG: hypothetical protein EXR77_13495 [Myxococcales bacterium]|nr:hypothetical protein [Myxococcales bacterium]